MRGQTVYPSKILNDERGVFGLYFSDFGGAVFIFIFWSVLFEKTALHLAAIPVAILALAVLIPIRLSTRRRILRDAASYFLQKRGFHGDL